MSEDFSLEQTKVKILKYTLQSKKIVTGVNFDVFTVFLGEHVVSALAMFTAGSEKLN